LFYNEVNSKARGIRPGFAQRRRSKVWGRFAVDFSYVLCPHKVVVKAVVKVCAFWKLKIVDHCTYLMETGVLNVSLIFV